MCKQLKEEKMNETTKVITLPNGSTKTIEIKPKMSEVNKKRLADLLSQHNERDLRFLYFDAPHNYKVTAVTKVYREDGILAVAFSFCSPKDTFCRTVGKIRCLKRLEEFEKVKSNNGYNTFNFDLSFIVTMAFADTPKVFNVGYAYNLLINKPERLINTKFYFDVIGGIGISNKPTPNTKDPDGTCNCDECNCENCNCPPSDEDEGTYPV